MPPSRRFCPLSPLRPSHPSGLQSRLKSESAAHPAPRRPRHCPLQHVLPRTFSAPAPAAGRRRGAARDLVLSTQEEALNFKGDPEEGQRQPKAGKRGDGGLWEHLSSRRGGAEDPRRKGGGGGANKDELEATGWEAEQTPLETAISTTWTGQHAGTNSQKDVTGLFCKEKSWPNTPRYFLRNSRHDHRPGQCPSLRFAETKATRWNDFSDEKQMEPDPQLTRVEITVV